MLIIYYNFLWALALLSFYGATVYYFYQLNYLGLFLTIILALNTFIILKKQNKVKKNQDFYQKINLWTEIKRLYKNNGVVLAVLFLFLEFFNLFIIWQAKTDTSIISPWEKIPSYFFVFFALETLLIVYAVLKTKWANIFYILMLSIYLIIPFGMATLIYSIGFGFDPFVHQATEKLIALNGLVTPKPLYYLGQYALIIFFHKIFFIPIIWLDKLLVPVLSSLLLPTTFYKSFAAFNLEPKQRLLSTLTMLILPFAVFTVTTPQNLANLFVVLIVLSSLIPKEQLPVSKLLTINLLAIATLAVHPLAGIPALIFAGLYNSHELIRNKKILMLYYSCLSVIAVGALPIAFVLSNQKINVLDNMQLKFALPPPFLSGLSDVWLNFSYLYGFNIFWLLIFLIILGALVCLKNDLTKNNFKKRLKHLTDYTPHILISVALTCSYLIMLKINFSYLIDYERTNFADRILTLIIIFSLPLIMSAITAIITKISRQKISIKYPCFIFIIALICASLYQSYPRLDDYENSRSFSTSMSDIKAVRWINADAGDNDNFIVLANQQVSAAALKEFGFKKYFPTPTGELFYYPIPTGDALYQFYLDMVDKQASKETATAAATIVNADITYFVLNSYWFAFEKILAEASSQADAIANIDENKIFVFKYTK